MTAACPHCGGALDSWPRVGLTARQREVLGFISASIAATGLSPTYREIGSATGMRLGAVTRTVHALEDRGHLIRKPHCAWSIHLIS